MKKKVLVSDDSRINNNLSEENIFAFMINNEPISLEIEILAENNKIYKYGFEVLNNAIISEWLYEKRVNKFYEIFDRTNNNIEVKDNKNKLLGLANVNEKTLFLNVFAKIDKNTNLYYKNEPRYNDGQNESVIITVRLSDIEHIEIF